MFAQEFDINIAKKVWQEEAREDGLQESAKAMLRENTPIDFILKVTGLPREQVEDLMLLAGTDTKKRACARFLFSCYRFVSQTTESCSGGLWVC